MSTPAEPQRILDRDQFDVLARRAGLQLPAGEIDKLYEGFAYIEAMAARLDRVRGGDDAPAHIFRA